jgi:hypothetical protein
MGEPYVRAHGPFKSQAYVVEPLLHRVQRGPRIFEHASLSTSFQARLQHIETVAHDGLESPRLDLQRGLQLWLVADHQLRRGGGSGRPDIGHEIGYRVIGFMSYGAVHREF